MKNEYVTYGFGNIIDKSKIETNLAPRIYANKPLSAWWGSPINATYGWKEFCIDNKFKNKSYFATNNRVKWTLDGKIFVINNEDDLQDAKDHNLMKYYKDHNLFCFDFIKMKDNGYDAIELKAYYIGHNPYGDLAASLWGWDCESIVVLNPNKIKFL